MRSRRAKNFNIHIPRIKISEPGVYHIYIKNPLVVIEKIRGESKRGDTSDSEEDDETNVPNPAYRDKVI